MIFLTLQSVWLQMRLIKIHLFKCTSRSSYDNNRLNVEIQEMLNSTKFEGTEIVLGVL